MDDPNEAMGELTAQMIQRGRGHASSEEVARRRRLAQDVRAAREKLTSSIGLERTFEYELVKLFAQYHRDAFIALAMLAVAVSLATTLWLPINQVAIHFGLVFGSIAILLCLSSLFLRQDAETVQLKIWRRRFTLAELIQGVSWALLVYGVLEVEAPSARNLVLFILVMKAALTATLSATIPLAVYAGMFPLAAVLFVLALSSQGLHALMLAGMATSAQLFFLLLASRLYASAVTALTSRAEKDALFVELEHAKANSDEARRRAEETNLAKSRFLATMSHELRTPLNAILGFSEVMKNEVFGPHASPSYKEYSNDIHGSGQHLLTLINEILDLSRIEAGRYELKEEAVQLAYVVEDCRHMLNLRAKAKNQTVKEMSAPNLPRIWADERAVRQVVLNILSNAIKFTPPGGEITIKVGWTSSGGQYVSVKDTGPGIPEEEIPIVMSSFGRGSLAIKTAEQGSGLGLPIVKGLVDLHGGGFQIKSTPREGTEVIVTLPPARVMDALAPISVPEPDKPAHAA